MTLRAIETLKCVDIIYCEDKRLSSVLLNHFSIKTHLGSYHEHNADKARPEILERLKNGNSVALISDAGTPLISDPGYKLVASTQEAGFTVYTVPGASAVISALSVSGMPSDHFFFGGFLPTKEGERRRIFDEMKNFPYTHIYYEAPRRLLDTLNDILDCMGNREVCVARELTKTFEDVHRCLVEDMVAYYQNEGVLKGEVVLLIRGSKQEPQMSHQVDLVLKALMKGVSTKEASVLLSELTGLPRKQIYNRALELKSDDN